MTGRFTEGELRFLRAVAEQVPAARVVEVHVFPAMRQGHLETGVAVLAATRDVDVDADEDGDDGDGDHRDGDGDHARPVVVYVARYRYAIKGTERGAWTVDVTIEADAPLVTVGDVVRGVQRRAGESGDAVRLDGDAWRALVGQPAPVGAASGASAA